MPKWAVRALVIAMFVFVAAPLAAGDDKSDAVLGQVAINVADLARAEKYYGEVLGSASRRPAELAPVERA